MAKKNKKQTRKVTGSSASIQSRQAGVQARPASAQSAAPAAASYASRVSGPEFNPDYKETIKDLKRIGMLAGSFFVILLIISFFLR